MLSVDEALRLILEHAQRNVAVELPLDDALDRVLAEDIASDVDSPPHDKAMVDGYAIIAADFDEPNLGQTGTGTTTAELTLLEEVTAGTMPTMTVTRGYCTRIMTGAPLPEGADAVVMIERTEVVRLSAETRIRFTDNVRPGQHIMRRGETMRAGEVVLRAGQTIRPAQIGLLAEVGRAMVPVIPPVTVAILSTGNELVDAAQTPAPGQIRNSNGPMLAALVRRAGATPIQLGIARDDADELRRLIAEGLRSDMLVLSGGVSAGVLDLVPGILRDLGVEQVFHKVNLKPGKPIWFGVKRSESRSSIPAPLPPTLVFGLPGNPLGSLVCFELFVRPAIEKLSGRDADNVPGQSARQNRTQLGTLSVDFQHRGDRPTYFPAIVQYYDNVSDIHDVDGKQVGRDACTVTPVRWLGSADLRGFAVANALAIFNAGDRTWLAGESVEFVML